MLKMISLFAFALLSNSLVLASQDDLAQNTKSRALILPSKNHPHSDGKYLSDAQLGIPTPASSQNVANNGIRSPATLSGQSHYYQNRDAVRPENRVQLQMVLH